MGIAVTRLVASALAAVVLSAAGATNATAAPPASVTRAALRALAPQHGGRVVVFALGHSLPAGTAVAQQAGPSGSDGFGTIKPTKQFWLFWEDDAYQAYFEHPGRLLLVAAPNLRVIAREQTFEEPLVGGRPAAFLASEAAYHDPGNMVFLAARAVIASAAPHVAHTAAQPPIAIPSGGLAHDCMVTLGPRDDKLFAGNFKAMDQFAADAGLSASAASTVTDLRQTVTSYANHGCKDVLLYITGHGDPAPGTRLPSGFGDFPREATTTEPRVKIAGQGPTARYITAADLRALVELHPSINFKIKIDSCFSGRFATDRDRKTGRTLASEPNVWPLELSADAENVAIGAVEYINPKTKKSAGPVHDNPFLAGEFTNMDYHGLESWARSPTEVQAHPSLAQGLAASPTLGAAFNIGTDPKFKTASGPYGYWSRYSPPPVPPQPAGYKDATTFGGSTGNGCSGDAYLNETLTIGGMLTYQDYYFPSTIPDTCDIGIRNNGSGNAALNWSADVHDATTPSTIYFCHDGPPGSPPGEAPCPGGTANPANPPNMSITMDMCTLTCGMGISARWQIYFRVQWASNGTASATVHIHYSWSGS